MRREAGAAHVRGVWGTGRVARSMWEESSERREVDYDLWSDLEMKYQSLVGGPDWERADASVRTGGAVPILDLQPGPVYKDQCTQHRARDAA